MNSNNDIPFYERYYNTYGEYPRLLDYIKTGGLIAGLTAYALDKKPDSDAAGVVFTLCMLFIPVLLVIFALPILILFIIVGLAKK